MELYEKDQKIITSTTDDRGLTRIPTYRALVLVGNDEYSPGDIVYFREHVDITTKINVSHDAKRERFVDNPNTRVTSFKRKYLGEKDPGLCIELHEGDIKAKSLVQDFIFTSEVRKFYKI